MQLHQADLIAGLASREGGATFMRGIGSTWVIPSATIHGRYAVGGFSKPIVLKEHARQAANTLAMAISRMSRAIPGGECVGVWIDSGKMYVDHVRLFDDLSEAMEEASSNGEQAVFDMADKDTLDVQTYYDDVAPHQRPDADTIAEHRLEL